MLVEEIKSMTTAELRLSLIDKIMRMGEDGLQKMNSIAEQEVGQTSQIPDWHYEEIQRRRERYLAGEGKSYTIEEVIENARKAIQ